MLSRAALGALLLACVVPTPAAAVDAESVLTKGTWALGLQVGGGEQNNVENKRTTSGISFVNVEPRLGYFPFEQFGKGWIKGALETGLEGWFQYYLEPHTATAEGLKLALRYHVLGFGPLVPYIEATAGPAGTNLKVKEIRSTFAFVAEAGAGVSYFVTPEMAISAGYRFQHISNGGASTPNRGFNSDSGVIGLTYYFK
jgi:opacity protein-like surface antigen